MRCTRLRALIISAAGWLHLARSVAAFCPSRSGSLVPPSRARRPARCAAPLANEFDDWWEQRRAQHAAVDNQAWAAAKGKAASYDTGSAAGRAALRAARAKAASERAGAAAGAAGALELDEDFFWSSEMLSDESTLDQHGALVSRCWSPPPSSSVAVVLGEFLRSDYARQVFNHCRVAGTDYGQIRGMFISLKLVGGTLELHPKQAH